MSAADVLRRLEWSGDHGACPVCRACRRCAEMDGALFEGHRADCELSAALAAPPEPLTADRVLQWLKARGWEAYGKKDDERARKLAVAIAALEKLF